MYLGPGNNYINPSKPPVFSSFKSRIHKPGKNDLQFYLLSLCNFKFYLISRKYKSAAKQFLEANLDYCDCPDLMSAHNVAVYGGLTALATFERADLIKLVLSNSQFKVCSFKLNFKLTEFFKVPLPPSPTFKKSMFCCFLV